MPLALPVGYQRLEDRATRVFAAQPFRDREPAFHLAPTLRHPTHLYAPYAPTTRTFLPPPATPRARVTQIPSDDTAGAANQSRRPASPPAAIPSNPCRASGRALHRRCRA